MVSGGEGMKQQDVSVAGHELVSDLVDGRLRGAEFARGVEIAGSNEAGREAWHVYHVIGDAMRSQELIGWGADAGFAERVLSRLEQEAVEVASIAAQAGRIGADMGDLRGEATNRSRWMVVAAAGLSTLAVATAVIWSTGGNWIAGDGGRQLAQSGPVVAPAAVNSGQAESPVMIRDARLDELMAAHKQAGGATALQRPAMFLRNAAFDEGSR
jgi:sigma-E factor negative regulatory protein RseA